MVKWGDHVGNYEKINESYVGHFSHLFLFVGILHSQGAYGTVMLTFTVLNHTSFNFSHQMCTGYFVPMAW